jgi:hypothetical protein
MGDAAEAYAFRPIPVQAGHHRPYVHLPEHVPVPAPSSRIEPAHTAGFNQYQTIRQRDRDQGTLYAVLPRRAAR